MKTIRLWLAALILPKGYAIRRKYNKRVKKMAKEPESLPLPI